MNFKNRIMLMMVVVLLAWQSAGAVELDSKNRDPKYVENIVGRSKKIVDNLDIKNADAYTAVVNIISNRYFQLNDIYDRRDSIVKSIKASTLSANAKSMAIEAAQNEKDAALYRTHFAFPAALSLFIDEKKIEAVKDGMTFGVVNVTYTATLDMIPSLTEEEKTQIYAWLVEAREFAIDAENSHKKHEAFGKYKGRINNYLSARGYNLTKEREEWYKRIKEREEAAKK